MNVTWILSNNSSAPYFNWFAQVAASKKEINFTTICLHTEEPQMIKDMEKFGFKCYWIKYDYDKRKRGLIKSVFQLYKLFKKIKPDIIHSHLFDDTLASMVAGKLAGIKKRVITKGDSGFHYYYTPKWVRFDRYNNKWARVIVAISEENKDFIIEKEKAPESKIAVIHHGLPLYEITHQTDEIKKEFISMYQLKHKTVIGTICRFIEWKGYKQIVAAAEILIPKNPDLIFLFTGKGQQKQDIEKIVKEKKLEKNILFTNWIDPSKIPSLFGIMTVYLHAAKNEPFGFVIAEAMLNGIPVVSTKTGAAADAIIHKKSGYLCEIENPVQLAEGIEYILKNNVNNCIGADGKKRAENLFTIEKMYAKHIALYKQLL